jgi:hypothetical protein
MDDLFLFKRGTFYPFSSELAILMAVLAIEEVQILFR